jgi:hypothetical protein
LKTCRLLNPIKISKIRCRNISIRPPLPLTIRTEYGLSEIHWPEIGQQQRAVYQTRAVFESGAIY